MVRTLAERNTIPPGRCLDVTSFVARHGVHGVVEAREGGSTRPTRPTRAEARG